MYHLIAKIIEDDKEVFWESFEIDIGERTQEQVQEKLQELVDMFDNLDLELNVVNVEDE